MTFLAALLGAQCVLALPETSGGTREVRPTLDEVTAVWKLIIRQVPPFIMSVKADFIPQQHYPEIMALARAWDAMKDSPVSDEAAEKFWTTHYPQPLNPERLKMGKETLRRQKFQAEHGAAVTKLRKLAGKGVYQKLVAEGTIDASCRTCLIFVPLPCPSPKVQERTMKFMDEACKAAQQNHFKVLIVRSYYGSEDRLISGGSQEDTELATRYDPFIKADTVRMMDAIPGATATPWGLFYRGGELVLEGSVDTWGQNPQPVLKEFRP